MLLKFISQGSNLNIRTAHFKLAMKHPKKERTFVIIKPDGIQRSLIGDVLTRLERTGLKFIGMKMITGTAEQAIAHYAKDDEWFEKVGTQMIKNMEDMDKKPEKSALDYGKGVLNGLVDFMTCCPIVVMVLEGNQAVGIVKKLVGGTEPLTSDVGTIRGDLTLDSYEIANVDFRAVRNLVHASDQVSEAEREIAVWFNEDELLSYRHIAEGMLYDVNLDGIME
ncbi:nucleoside-diphosphate kinase [Candidatus Wolfebacteria bacterium]|nr:MAG: nucleoside-diphosphate kinase [Candidatus Wolfebacteria bacterium]